MSTPENTKDYKEHKPRISAIIDGVNELQTTCFNASVRGGWWHDLATGERKERNKAEMLCLIHSEVSEVMEGVRKNLMDDKLTHRTMEEVELADVIIRVMDYAGGHNLDVAGAIVEKLAYNAVREDHKIENRVKDDGKKF